MNTQLRFPQFTDEWQVKKLGDITTRMQSGLSRKLSNTDIGLPVIRSNNIQDQSIKTSDISYWYVKDPQGAKTESYFLENGDLLINFINSLSQIGKFAIYKDELNRPAIFTTNIMRLSFSKDVNADFIFYSLCSKRYTDYIQSITKPAVNQASFTTVDLKKFKLKLPSLDEQEKIAEFLTAVDERIALMEKKLELLKKYKKGVMQKIFTQQIRFKDENGDLYPDWEERKLGRIGETYTGLTGKSADDFGDGSNFITYMQIFSNSRIDTDKFAKVKVGAEERQNKVKEGDIFFTTSSETPEEIGYTSVLLDKVHDTYLNSFCFGYRADANILLPGFARFLFHSSKTRKSISRLAQGSTRFNLSKNTLMKMGIDLPSVEEQQEIVNFLTILDDKIELENKKLQKAKRFKKSLLQRMFV